MSEPLPEHIRASLCEAARESEDMEICGFIMSDWSLVFMPNAATEPFQFSMDDEATMDFYLNFDKPLGMFHSHPNGQEDPSQTDLDYAPVGLRYWIIVGEEIVEWEIDNDLTPQIVARSSPVLAAPDACRCAAVGDGDPAVAGQGGTSSG